MKALSAWLALGLCTIVNAQATTTSAASSEASYVPFSTLPSCAANCGPLYDAEYSCTGIPNYVSCFCAYGTLQPFYTSNSGVCAAGICADTDLTSIQSWFLGFCGTATTTAATASAATSTSTGTSGSNLGVSEDASNNAGSSSSSSSSSNPSWFDSHWKWVVMLIVLFLAIVIGWIAACFFRRRYLRKRDRNLETGTPVAWGPSQTQAQPQAYGDGVVNMPTEKTRGTLATGDPSSTTLSSMGPSPGKKGKRISKA